MKKRATNCENCSNYLFDDESGSYFCDRDLDEDEMYKFLTLSSFNCPYFDFYDEYKIVRKQN